VSVAEWTTNPYPKARTDRRAGSEIPDAFTGLIGPPPPRTYNWTWILAEQFGPSRGTIGSRRLVGPALIKRLTLDCQQPADSGDPAPNFQLWLQASPVTEGVDQAVALPAGAVSVFESTFRRNDVLLAAPRSPGLMLNITGGALRLFEVLIDRIVLMPEFYIGLSLLCEAGGLASQALGHLSVYENVPREQLVALLG